MLCSLSLQVQTYHGRVEELLGVLFKMFIFSPIFTQDYQRLLHCHFLAVGLSSAHFIHTVEMFPIIPNLVSITNVLRPSE
jgi:hypothetical protein